MDIFTHDFMLRAFAVAFLISVIMGLIGNVIVLRRLSGVGDALSHSGLAGVAIGLVVGSNPVVFSILSALLAAALLEGIRRAFPRYQEISTAVVMSLAVGVTAVASGFVRKARDLNSFLFGSIVAVTDMELYLVMVVFVLVSVIMVLFYRPLFHICFDEENAIITGIKAGRINFMFSFVTAATVAVSAKTTGALVISSLIVLPVACSMLISRSYFSNTVLSVVFAVFFTMAGLFLSYYADVKPGGAIVLLGAATLGVIIAIKKIFGG